MSVRVRFAPSPTGYLHVGGLRTALYNYLFARHHGGKCILRIEDTDRTRYVENAVENLVSSLNWAGVEFDEGPMQGGEYGPYVQSERTEIYRKHAFELIEKRAAYYAFDTAEELDQMRQEQKGAPAIRYDRNKMRNQFTLGIEEASRLIENGEPYVVRMVIPDELIEFDDIIRGKVKVHGRDIDDQILLKSDGFPTYHLANVVDDHMMGITHVIRGEEWLPSTPKHVALYDSFGWERPQFAHLPLLLNKDKTKLSKRTGSVAVEDFARKYIRDAFVNFVALLGWNPTADREIFSIDELIESFNLEKVNKGGAVFDVQKLDWMNGQYLRQMPADELAKELMPKLRESGWDVSEDYARRVVELFIERITFIDDIIANCAYMFEAPTDYDEKYMKKHWKDDTLEYVRPLVDKLGSLEEFTHDSTHEATKEYVAEKDIKLKVVIHPLRLMITGMSFGAGMFETMELLGRDECISRCRDFIEKIEKDEIKPGE